MCTTRAPQADNRIIRNGLKMSLLTALNFWSYNAAKFQSSSSIGISGIPCTVMNGVRKKNDGVQGSKKVIPSYGSSALDLHLSFGAIPWFRPRLFTHSFDHNLLLGGKFTNSHMLFSKRN